MSDSEQSRRARVLAMRHHDLDTGQAGPSRELLAKMIITLKDIRNFSVLMLLFMFIYTLLGMELYAYRVKFSNEDKDEVSTSEGGVFPRANFNTFLSGFTTIFIVFIGEDWNASMYDHVRATGNGSIFFFILLFNGVVSFANIRINTEFSIT